MTTPARRPAPADRVVTSANDRRRVILDTIRGAERRLLLSLFRCNDDEIFQELGHAVARGVAVEVLTTARAKGGRKRIEKLWQSLGRTGATVHRYPDPVVKYHAKYLVADEGPALVASLNLTRKCFTRTWDAMVVTYDADVVSGLQRLLAADRDGQPLPDAVTSRLIVGPERARQQFTALIAQARESISLMDAKLSDPELVALLHARRASGVNVQLVDAKQVGELKSHGKMMLLDNRTVVVGGLALSALSLGFRREVAIIVEDPGAVADVEQWFKTMLTMTAERRLPVEPRGATPC
jgi:cardiolipin synthase